ncbi:hypothetical protein RF11_06989 [Thelohanellus kitauei]|uniref:Uncharacterized protein n=1 Tax=Thelohanellus kitauei TaxID=669202 RepID=A0A0C2JMQ3_THEKT|nr:hypothetical protein RF11_06989 [Thelohanellus kitauei]
MILKSVTVSTIAQTEVMNYFAHVCLSLIPDTSNCIGNELFTCYDGSKICISRVCDGIEDCDDGSDEGDRCTTNDNIKIITSELKGHGRISFSWVYGESSSEFNVTVQSM